MSLVCHICGVKGKYRVVIDCGRLKHKFYYCEGHKPLGFQLQEMDEKQHDDGKVIIEEKCNFVAQGEIDEFPCINCGSEIAIKERRMSEPNSSLWDRCVHCENVAEKAPKGCGTSVGWTYKDNQKDKVINCGDKLYNSKYIELCDKCQQSAQCEPEKEIKK